MTVHHIVSHVLARLRQTEDMRVPLLMLGVVIVGGIILLGTWRRGNTVDDAADAWIPKCATTRPLAACEALASEHTDGCGAATWHSGGRFDRSYLDVTEFEQCLALGEDLFRARRREAREQSRDF